MKMGCQGGLQVGINVLSAHAHPWPVRERLQSGAIVIIIAAIRQKPLGNEAIGISKVLLISEAGKARHVHRCLTLPRVRRSHNHTYCYQRGVFSHFREQVVRKSHFLRVVCVVGSRSRREGKCATLRPSKPAGTRGVAYG